MGVSNLIVAFTHKSFGIGAKGGIPWNIPEDRAHFRKVTMGHVCVMGRRTFESLGSQPLVGRFNIVVTEKSDSALQAQNLTFVRPQLLDTHTNLIHGTDETIFICGGTKLYEKYIGTAERIYATIVEKEFPDMDTFFPVYSGLGKYYIEEAGPRLWSNNEKCFYRMITYRLGCGSSERGYIDLVRDILTSCKARPDRTGVGTLSVFGRQLRFDVSKTIPVLTTRSLGIKTIVRELLWFLRGSCDSKELERDGVHIWAGNTSRAFLDARGLQHYAEGETGPLYGWSLRRFGAPYKIPPDEKDGCLLSWMNKRKSEHGDVYRPDGFDQLEALVAGLITDPFSRRHLMTTFNPSVVEQCVLAPCHGIAIQFYVEESKDEGQPMLLSCHVYCRSSDTFLGLPFNIASYAILLHLIAKRCGYAPKELVMSTGDTHIYSNHVKQAWTQINREPLPAPRLIIADAAAKKDWSQLTVDDFEIVGYLSHPPIKAEMAV